jgi:hypothetical protein
MGLSSIARAIIGGGNALYTPWFWWPAHDGHPRDSGAHFRQTQTVIPPRPWGDL